MARLKHAVAVLTALALTPAYAALEVDTGARTIDASVVANVDAYLSVHERTAKLLATSYEDTALRYRNNHTGTSIHIDARIVAGDPAGRFELAGTPADVDQTTTHDLDVRDTDPTHPSGEHTLTIRTDATVEDAGGATIGQATTWHNVSVEVGLL